MNGFLLKKVKEVAVNDSGYNEDVEISYDRVVAETDFAYRVYLAALLVDKKPWVPKSIIRSIDETNCSMVVPYWFAKEKGFI